MADRRSLDVESPQATRRYTSALAGLGARLIAAGAAAANAAEPVRSVSVAYGDLNLASEQGNNTLYDRIVAAAREVCGAGSVDIRDLQVLADKRACETHAIAHAVEQVPSAKPADIHL